MGLSPSRDGINIVSCTKAFGVGYAQAKVAMQQNRAKNAPLLDRHLVMRFVDHRTPRDWPERAAVSEWWDWSR
jgi:hypothetical protein